MDREPGTGTRWLTSALLRAPCAESFPGSRVCEAFFGTDPSRLWLAKSS